MKKIRKTLPIVIQLIILLSISFGIIQANNSLVNGVIPTDFYIGENMSWQVQNITTGNIQWFNWTSFTFQENWHADIGDKVNLTISDSKIINDKTYLEGLFKIGNLSLGTNNYDIGFNLVFSCNPWVGGLIALEPNWDDLSDQSPFNGTSASIKINDEYLIFGKTVAAVRIQYNDAFQISNLIYEKETGILLFAQTNVGFFRLTLILEYSSIPLPNATHNFGPGLITTLIVGCISLIILKKKRK